jgi:divalent metal cation (Fe/Co/Zn/Cd) transporter
MDDREPRLRAAGTISTVSLSLGLVVGATALVLAATTGSVVLAAFGFESLVDAGASGLLVWRFRVERREPHRAEVVERRAERALGVVLLLVSAYLVVASVRSLVVGSEPHESAGSIILAAVSVVVLPGIAYRKLSLARQLGSRSLRADGLLTTVGAVLAAVTLVAIVVTKATGVHAVDPVAALIVTLVLVREAASALSWTRASGT